MVTPTIPDLDKFTQFFTNFYLIIDCSKCSKFHILLITFEVMLGVFNEFDFFKKIKEKDCSHLPNNKKHHRIKRTTSVRCTHRRCDRSSYCSFYRLASTLHCLCFPRTHSHKEKLFSVKKIVDAARCIDVNHRSVGNPKRKI
jgi:hypothetical protein